MKKTEIIGKNYVGHWKDSRTTCRAIIVNDGKMLLSYESKNGRYMLPGGGLEAGESEKECCCREVAEETGLLVSPSECLLEISEYYESSRWIHKYFVCEVIGETPAHLTEREKTVGMKPIWMDTAKIKAIFADHRSFEGKDEVRRGMYLREYTALCELEGCF